MRKNVISVILMAWHGMIGDVRQAGLSISLTSDLTTVSVLYSELCNKEKNHSVNSSSVVGITLFEQTERLQQHR